MANKFNAISVKNDYGFFSSLGEYQRFLFLKDLEQIGTITNLTRQPKFQLIINDYLIAKYTADFKYIVAKTGETIIEDFKSAPTFKKRDFKLVAKMMIAIHGIDLLISMKEKQTYVQEKFSVCGKRRKTKSK